MLGYWNINLVMQYFDHRVAGRSQCCHSGDPPVIHLLSLRAEVHKIYIFPSVRVLDGWMCVISICVCVCVYLSIYTSFLS